MTPIPNWRPTVVLALLASGAIAATAPGQKEIHHHVTWQLGSEHATVTTTASGGARIMMPGYEPRSARPVDLARTHRQRIFTSGGKQLSFAAGAWVIPSGSQQVTHSVPLIARRIPDGIGQRNAQEVEIQGETKTLRYYEGYALRAVTTWPYVVGKAALPQRLTFELPVGIEVATTLPRAADGSYSATDYAALLDSAVHIGKFETLRFEAAGRRYAAHLTGFSRIRMDRKKFTEELTRIVNTQTDLLGPPPASSGSEYVFLFGRSTSRRTATGHRAGAEIFTHSLQSSAVLHTNLARAHLWSWFHAIDRPRDLQQPTGAAEDWFLRGALDYLTELTALRAGQHDPKRFWTQGLATHINKLQIDKRRLSVSVADAGLRIHGKGRNRPPKGPDPRIKGLLLSLLLDIEIRSRSQGQRNLATAVQSLVKTHHPVTNATIQRACTTVGGSWVDGFFGQYIHGTEELPFIPTLRKIGVEARTGRIRAAKPAHPRIPQKKSKRPPRWYADLMPKAPKATLELRAGMSGGA